MKSRCFFIATSWNDGAIANHFKALSKKLVERGHRVVILITGQKRWVEDHESNPSIYVWPSLRPTNLRDAIFLYRLIRKYRPDCLISNFGADNVMLLVGWLMRVPSRVAWYHTLISQIEIDGETTSWKARLLKLRKQIVYRGATFIVSVSGACRDDVQRVFQTPERKCRVLHNSLSDPLPGLNLDPTVNSGQNRLVCVGRMHPTKGQDTLIRAVAILKHKVPDITVEFIGDGPFRESCLQLVHDLKLEDACIFEGDISHDEVLKRMALATATVVPSRSEGFGLVNIESLAVGTPVVASCVGGIVEVIRDGVDGFLVPPDDPDALADRLHLLLSKPQLRSTMSRNARERFLSTFEQSKGIKEQADWLETVS